LRWAVVFASVLPALPGRAQPSGGVFPFGEAYTRRVLNHGANLRAVQMLLEHSSLSTTQIYTHVASKDLKELHERHHPRG
jgi:site-specific recombinase XerD